MINFKLILNALFHLIVDLVFNFIEFSLELATAHGKLEFRYSFFQFTAAIKKNFIVIYLDNRLPDILNFRKLVSIDSLHVLFKGFMNEFPTQQLLRVPARRTWK